MIHKQILVLGQSKRVYYSIKANSAAQLVLAMKYKNPNKNEKFNACWVKMVSYSYLGGLENVYEKSKHSNFRSFQYK